MRPNPYREEKQTWGRKQGDYMTTRRNIVRDIEGNRYLLTSRRLVQLDSEDAKEGTPWYATNQDIRTVASQLSADGTDHILVRSRTSKDNATIVRVLVPIGKTGDVYGVFAGTYHIGCGYFTLTTYLRILRNAGVKTIKKAFAAAAGL